MNRDRHANYEVRKGTLDLAKKLSGPSFLTSLRKELPEVSLNSPPGKIISAALNAYDKVDEVLLSACLTYMEQVNNTNRKDACFQGLKRCADSFADEILAKACASDAQSMGWLCLPEQLFSLFGDFEGLLDASITAFSQNKIENVQQLSLVLVASTLPRPNTFEDFQEQHAVERLTKNMVRNKREWSDEIREQYHELCEKHKCWGKCKALPECIRGIVECCG